MLKKFIGISFLAALGMAQAAQAADLAVVEETVIVAPAFSWTGFYAGVHVGYGWADLTSEFNDSLFGGEGSSPDGWLAGGQVGYNYQFSNNIVLGIEADASFSNLKDSASLYTTVNLNDEDYFLDAVSQTKISPLGTVRARAGYAVDRFLPYVTGGFAWANAKSTVRVDTDYTPVAGFNTSDSQIFTGWTVGAGLEYAVTNNITAKIEYLYADLGKKDFNYGPNFQSEGDLSSLETVKLGLNYKF
ncbi:outer membrane protein [Kaistia sp. UC242_56]|uniref:outer membrane protein n=1 Tax=Kaistia sp. UC242_56 TaxID=3374625 RepID=UPI00379772FE